MDVVVQHPWAAGAIDVSVVSDDSAGDDAAAGHVRTNIADVCAMVNAVASVYSAEVCDLIAGGFADNAACVSQYGGGHSFR